ncbi:MAG: cation:proton antiporter [Cytophagaceae bacterium]
MTLSHADIVNLLLALSTILIAGRLMGEVFRKIGQPSVIGEILAGIILGPTILGMIFPDIFHTIFPRDNYVTLALDGFTQVSVILLLFIAGLEVELDVVMSQGKKAAIISLFSIAIPFALGFGIPMLWPELLDVEPENKYIFSLFFGTALSITALPVIARILMDLNLFKSNFGILIITSAMVNDLLGWMFFAVILSLINPTADANLWGTLGTTILFTLLMLTIGKFLFNKILPWINKNFAWPGGILSISIALCLLAASFTEFVGIHGIFGAFIFGVALSSSFHFKDRAKEIIHHFINNIFAPIFFVGIGLKVNFIENFDWLLTVLVIAIAFAGKMIGGTIGAKLSGYNLRESMAISSGMNARGAMEIILGLLALQANIINEEMFVAIVIMALFTSITSGPMMKFFLHKK